MTPIRSFYMVSAIRPAQWFRPRRRQSPRGLGPTLLAICGPMEGLGAQVRRKRVCIKRKLNHHLTDEPEVDIRESALVA